VNQINNGNLLLPTVSESDCQPETRTMSAIADATFQRKVAHLMIAYEILPIILLFRRETPNPVESGKFY
jgi:hypothetical protein